MKDERTPPSAWLYIVRIAIDPKLESDWNQWYDSEHLPDILACPGFLGGARYVSESQAGRSYMTVYTITDPAALDTPEFQKAKGWYRFAPAVEFTTDVYRPVAAAPYVEEDD